MSKLTDRNIILLLVLLQLAVCLPFINSFPIALDEPFSIFWAQQDIGEMYLLFASENNPPLHFILLHYWIELFGIDPMAVRSLSLVFSLLTIPVIFNFAKKIVNSRMAALIVLIFICSRFNHYHAIEARTYSLFILLGTLSFYELYQILFEDKKSYVLFVIWNSLLLYTHYLGTFVIAIEVILSLLFFRSLTKFKVVAFSISCLIIFLLYLPGVNWFFKRVDNFSENGTWVPKAQYSELYGNIIRFFNNTFCVLSCALIFLVFLFVFRKKTGTNMLNRLFKRKHLFIYLMFIVPYFGMFIFSKLIQPIFLDRYLLFTTIPLFISTVVILSEIIPDEKKYLSFIILIPLGATTNWIPENNREPDAEVEYVKSIEKDNTLKVLCPPYYDLTFLYHYDRKIFEDYRQQKSLMKTENIQPVYNFGDIEQEYINNDLLFIDCNSKFVYPDNTVKSSLDSCMDLKSERSFKGGIVIYQYIRK